MVVDRRPEVIAGGNARNWRGGIPLTHTKALRGRKDIMSNTMPHCVDCRPSAECTCAAKSSVFWICSFCGNQNSRLDGECDGCIDPANHTCESDPCPYCDNQVVTVTYRITHSHGLTEQHETYDQALSALKEVYGPAIQTEGDPDDLAARVLVWHDAESARDDDGARAVAAVKPLQAIS